MEFDKECDARNLNCPLPILRFKKSLNEIEPEQTLKVLATDPGSVKDLHAFCKQTGHEMLHVDETESLYTFFIKKRVE